MESVQLPNDPCWWSFSAFNHGIPHRVFTWAKIVACILNIRSCHAVLNNIDNFTCPFANISLENINQFTFTKRQQQYSEIDSIIVNLLFIEAKFNSKLSQNFYCQVRNQAYH